jgi:hypothetical protein
MEKSELAKTVNGEAAKSNIKSKLIVFFGMKGIVPREVVLVDQSICHSLWQLLENIQRLCPPDFGDERIG